MRPKFVPGSGKEAALYGDCVERKRQDEPSSGAQFARKNRQARDGSRGIPDSQRGKTY